MKHRGLLGILLMAATLRAEEPAPTTYQNDSFHFQISAPPNWHLFPEEDLPEDMAALLFQTGPDGEPTGASVSIRVYEDQVHSELDFVEFAGLFQLNVRSLGLEMEAVTRREYGSGSKMRISLEYSVDEEVKKDGAEESAETPTAQKEVQKVWYKQMFYQVGEADVLMLSGKDTFEHREESVRELNDIFDQVRIEGKDLPEATPVPLDLPTPKP